MLSLYLIQVTQDFLQYVRDKQQEEEGGEQSSSREEREAPPVYQDDTDDEIPHVTAEDLVMVTRFTA